MLADLKDQSCIHYSTCCHVHIIAHAAADNPGLQQCVGGIVQETSLIRNHGGEIMEEES